MKQALRPSVILHFVILVITPAAFTQPPPINFQHLSIEQGLSNKRLFAITQDKYGLIWIATGDGLNRFDGYNVDVYRHERGNKKSLPNNIVRSLFSDSNGSLWIGTQGGLAHYDFNSNCFQSYFHNSNDENSLPSDWISVITQDPSGLLWIGTSSGLCSFDRNNSRFQRFVHNKHSNSISGNFIKDIDFAPDGTMWITTSNGLNRLDLSTKKFTSFFHDKYDSTTLSGNNLTKMAIDKNGDLWTSRNGSLNLDCFNTKTNRSRRYRNLVEKQSQIPANYLRDIFIDRSGKLWITTNAGGLNLFIPGKNDLFEYKADFLDPTKLQSNSVVGVYQDFSGMIWLSTFNGAERFNPHESKFIIYRPVANTSVVNNVVNAIAEDSLSRLWIGTNNGVSILDRNTGTYTSYEWKQNSPNSLNYNNVHSLCCDTRGNMWIGTTEGVSIFNPIQKNFREFYAKRDTFFGASFIRSIVCDKKGNLLIGGTGGLSMYNFEDDSVHALLNESTNTIFQDNHGIIWIGTMANGLIKYNRLTRELERFTNIMEDTTSLASNSVISITEDHKGELWISTISGLCRFDKITRKFTTFSEKNGLPNVNVTQLLVDDRNRIWMGTHKGISMLDESRTIFTNYDPSDGLQGWEFTDGSAYKTHDGYFCYSGINGFNMFHPDSLRKNSFIPPLILKRITISDQPLDIDSSYSNLKSLKLSYKENFFSFEFAALNYDHPEKNKYAYQLIGFDKKMVYLGTDRVVKYTNVSPGEYTLKVIASNNDGVWNEKGFEFNITITPPFWATWWFKTIAVSLFIGSVFLFFKLREIRIRKVHARQTAINKQIAEIKMVALRGQMNPHFIFNSLNSIQHFITIRNREEALNYLSKFSKLIRKILENSRENTVTISNEMQLLELYIQLEQLRFNHRFDYHIAIDEKIDVENTEIPPLLIQPYIENAILHGLINKAGKGDLWLSLERNNGLLICKIEDNGIGRARAQEIEQRKVSRHKSLGIKVTEERISELFALLDYNMEVVVEDLFETEKSLVEPQQPAGTRVTISIPLKEEE